jgi:hypothetical protein
MSQAYICDKVTTQNKRKKEEEKRKNRWFPVNGFS